MYSKKRILIVEDDLAMKQLLSLILEHVGFEVVRAGNGNEGIRMLEAYPNHIDLILSDILMDEMDGFEFITLVKNNPKWKSIPFIFLTGKVDAHSRIAGLRLGADDYLLKPFNRDEVVLKIKSILDKAINIKKNTITGLNGSLSVMTMKEVCQIISITKRTGLLVLVSDRIGGALYFKNGALINAASEDNFGDSWGEIWGEESAYKLICLTEGNFRFEPRNVDEIPVVVTHSIDDILEHCIRPEVNQDKIEQHIQRAFVLSSPDVPVVEPIAEPVPEPAPIAEPVPEPVSKPVPQPAPEVMARQDASIDSMIAKLKRYEDKHDLFAMHIGIIGSRANLKDFMAALLLALSVVPERITFDSSNILSTVKNFTLIKIKIKEQTIYFHSVFDDPGEERLWPNMLVPSAGIIILRDLFNTRYMESIELFAGRYRMKCVVHNTLDQSQPLDLQRIITLIGDVVSA